MNETRLRTQKMFYFNLCNCEKNIKLGTSVLSQFLDEKRDTTKEVQYI